MNKEDITRMAREAGIPLGIRLINSVQSESCVSVELERFFQAAYAAGAAAEREECATDLEAIAAKAKEINPEGFVCKTIQECADFIRARGNT